MTPMKRSKSSNKSYKVKGKGSNANLGSDKLMQSY